jgi:hypothetical protein
VGVDEYACKQVVDFERCVAAEYDGKVTQNQNNKVVEIV